MSYFQRIVHVNLVRTSNVVCWSPFIELDTFVSMICPESSKQHFKSELIDLVQIFNAKLLEMINRWD